MTTPDDTSGKTLHHPMSKDAKAHFDLNRPIHLARRNVFFERGIELLYTPLHKMNTAARLEHIEKILVLLKTSEKHAFFSTQCNHTTQQEADFLRFLRMLHDNVQAVQAMMQHQAHLEMEESFLCQFLNTSSEQCVLPAMHYQRRAEDILQGLWNMLQLAHTPYRALQEANTQSMSADERNRYNKAYASFREEVNVRFSLATDTI